MECLNHIWKEVSWRMVMVDCWGCWSWSWCLSSHSHLTSTWILQLIFKNNLPAPASVSELHLAAGTKIFFLQYLKGGRSNSEMWDVKRITRQKVRQGLICARAGSLGPAPHSAAGQKHESFEHLISFMMAGAGGGGVGCHWPVCDKWVGTLHCTMYYTLYTLYYAVASHYWKKIFCGNSDDSGFIWSFWPLTNFCKWHGFRSNPPLTHYEFG